VREIIAGIEDRAGAQRRIDQAVVHARNDGASWTAIGAALGVSRQAALKRYGDCGRAPAKSAPR
jgi:hypothetical protein